MTLTSRVSHIHKVELECATSYRENSRMPQLLPRAANQGVVARNGLAPARQMVRTPGVSKNRPFFVICED